MHQPAHTAGCIIYEFRETVDYFVMVVYKWTYLKFLDKFKRRLVVWQVKSSLP